VEVALLSDKLKNDLLSSDLSKGIDELGIAVSKELQERLLNYLALLVKWNKTYNLTSIRDPRLMVSGHLLDSIAVVPSLWPGNWLDVGCGAGLPGIVLAIIRPEWSFTLIDSNSKKTSFVQQVIIELNLKNVVVRCERIEDWESEEKFDGIISRAFTETGRFITLTRHLLKKEGRWVAMKGNPDEELQRIQNDISVEQIINLKVPKLDAARCLVILRENK
jgi:16S rRNA (guanine527-N7)-methyltransferase